MQAQGFNMETLTKPQTSCIIQTNPATGEKIAEIKNHTKEEVFALVKKARKAQPSWAKLSFRERASYILVARQYILNKLDELAETISSANGKPRVEALSADIYPVLDLMNYFAKNTERLLRPKRIAIGVWNWMLRSSWIEYYPKGVVGIISPWNFPFSIPMGETAMALMTGNTVILKPSSSTALVGVSMEKIFKEAGLPEGVFNHASGDSSCGDALLEAGLDKIFFTGSVAIGKYVMEKVAKTLTPVVLELGGKDPMIVCEDANLDVASSGAVWGAFTNSGQVCASVERVYVQESVAQKFKKLVLEKTQKLRQGHDASHNVDVGAITTKSQLEEVDRQIQEAKTSGAKILTGGNKRMGGYFFEPTILDNVDHSFRTVKEETFGPTLPLMTFRRDEEAIHLANDTSYGLTASVWSRDLSRAKRIASQIKAGTVTINDCTFTHAICQTPWGGHHDTGFGRSHGEMGLMEMVEARHVHLNRLTSIKNFWWYPYNKDLYQVFKSLAPTLSLGNLWGLVRSLPNIIRAIRLPKL